MVNMKNFETSHWIIYQSEDKFIMIIANLNESHTNEK